MRTAIFVLLLGALVGKSLEAKTIQAVTCNSTDVQTAINSSLTGDTVIVPAGTCSWTGLTLSKAITLQGAGQAVSGTSCPLAGSGTNIRLGSGNHVVTITKQASGVTRVTGFNFSNAGGLGNHSFLVSGSWQNAQPVIFQNDSFCGNNTNMGDIFTPGGVIFSHNYIVGTWDNGAVWTIKDASNVYNSWRVADTMGNRDTNGLLNVYFEGNTFYGSTNAFIDCDDGCRVVVRHNSMAFASFNSHGYDTSPYGMRHFEIYNNTWTYPGPNITDQNGVVLGNQNWVIWIRGGTGVIFSNSMANISNSSWGNKPQVSLNCRACGDPTLIGLTCGNIAYPIHGNAGQLGQNYNGSSFFTDPIYIWSNTGGPWTVPEGDGYGWTNTCGNHVWGDFFRWGRDSINQAISGGSAKPGYTPYTYPHPLTQVGGTPAPPTNLVATPH